MTSSLFVGSGLFRRYSFEHTFAESAGWDVVSGLARVDVRGCGLGARDTVLSGIGSDGYAEDIEGIVSRVKVRWSLVVIDL
jgi:hypothetical protein